MSDGIIDIRPYLDAAADDDAGPFALWGGDGERSRFALPLWRCIYLAGGNRGGILSMSLKGAGGYEPLIVLDLATDPPRLGFESFDVPAEVPEGGGEIVLDDADAGILVFLGREADRAWYLAVDGVRAPKRPLEARAREDVLFLCGECAGLLFFRDLAGP